MSSYLSAAAAEFFPQKRCRNRPGLERRSGSPFTTTDKSQERTAWIQPWKWPGVTTAPRSAELTATGRRRASNTRWLSAGGLRLPINRRAGGTGTTASVRDSGRRPRTGRPSKQRCPANKLHVNIGCPAYTVCDEKIITVLSPKSKCAGRKEEMRSHGTAGSVKVKNPNESCGRN